MKTQYDAFFGSSALMIVTYIMMAAGGLVVLISLAGCVGAYTRSRLILGIVSMFKNEPLWLLLHILRKNVNMQSKSCVKGSSQHKVGGEWFEIKLGKISRMLVKYEVLLIPNVIFVC